MGAALRALWGGTKAIAAGKAQANLGIQSPHLPAAIVRVGRFAFSTSAVWILGTWYSAYVNMRTQPGSGPKLVLPGKPIIGNPSRAEKNPKFATGGTTQVEIPGGASGQATFLPGGGVAGGFLPSGATYKPGRADQGRDGQTAGGGPVVAPGNGRVVAIHSDPGGFGPDYPIVKFTSGPYRGRIIYIGHTHTALRAGATFSKDQILSYTGKMPVGNASVPGWFEIGFADNGSPGPYGQATPF